MRGRRTNAFQKAVVICALVCFAIIWGVTIYKALTEGFTNLTGEDAGTGLSISESLGWGWRIVIILVLAVPLFCFFRAAFRHFAGCSMRRLRVDVVVLFLFSLVLYLILIPQFRIMPITDSHSVLDQALSLARNGWDSMTADSVYANYFSKYSNNYPVTLFFSGYFWLVEKLGVTDIYLSAYVLNVVCLMLGSLFAWLAAKRAFGPRTAARVLLLCVMNPVYYLMAFWVYTNTISVPFVMALIYLALCVRDAKNRRARLLLTAAFGAVGAVGVQLRATTAIPIIAIAICFGIVAIRYFWRTRKNCLGWTGVIITVLAVMAGVYLSISTACNRCFSEVSDGNYPITHWLMMGSHGNGIYNTTDDGYTFSFETAEEKKEATLNATIENYKELGVTGSAQLFLRKMAITWSDGYFASDKRLGQTMRDTSLYALLVGEQSDPFRLYCQVFWLAVGFYVLCACIRCLTDRRMRMLPFLLILTLFGAIVFYWFWEVKAAYALPFLPVFYLLAGYGSGLLQAEENAHVSTQKQNPGDMREKHAVCVIIIFLAIIAYQRMNAYEITHYKYSIYSSGGSWMKSINLSEDDVVTQEFYPNAAFNRIALRVKVQSEEDATNDCSLQVTLVDASGAVVYQGMITAEDVDDQMAVLSVGEHPADIKGGYVLTVTKETGSSGNLLLRTRKGLCLDDYRGTFTICGEAQVTDLYLQVYREYTGAYFS